MTDLEELASLSVSMRRVALGALMMALIAFGAGVALSEVNPDLGWAKPLAIAVLGLGSLGFAVVMKIRTPPGRFPTVRVLRDHASQVAYIVAVTRGNSYLVLMRGDARLLAHPLQLKGAARVAPGAAAVAEGLREMQDQTSRALEIAQRRCPDAKVLRTHDMVGLTSVAKLAFNAVQKSN